MSNKSISKIYNKKILKIYIWLIFLFPTFWGFSKGSNSLGQLLISVSLFLFVITYSIFKYNSIKFIKSYLCVFSLQLLFYLFTLTIRTADFRSLITISDFSDIIRPILYLVAVSAPISLGIKKKDVNSVCKTLVFVGLGVTIFDIIKFFPGGELILKLYTPLEPNSFNYMRFSGTFAYCYNYGYILIFLLFYCIYEFRNKLLWTSIVMLIIFLTGSRSVLLATIVSFFCYFLMLPKSMVKKIVILIGFVLGVIVFYYIINSSFAS